jgi:Uma2 family endonuclease
VGSLVRAKVHLPAVRAEMRIFGYPKKPPIMSHQHLLDQILDLPDAPRLVQQATDKLAQERIQREQFYNDIDESMKAEFINGEMIVHSPVMIEHNEANGLLFQLLNVYVRKNQLGFVGFEKIMIVLTRNDYEPDIVFFGPEKANQFKKGQTLFPAPDLVVEVLSKGTAGKDPGIKFTDYEAHGVGEYWIVDAQQEVVEQYLLVAEAYELTLKSGNGTIKSRAIAGFEIPIRAMFDESANLAALQQLLR